MAASIKTITHLSLDQVLIYFGILLIPFYMIFCNGKRCYIFDEIRFGEALANKHPQFVDRFVQFVATHERASLAKFLQEMFRGNHKGLIDFVEHAKAYSAEIKARPGRELHPFIRDSLYRPYVPGTSIKGALRTAIMYVMLKRMGEAERKHLLEDTVKNKLERIQTEIRRGKGKFIRNEEKYFDQDIEVDLMWKYFFDEAVMKFDPHSDILRTLKVSDTEPLDPNSAVIEKVEVYNRGYATGIKIYVETLPAGTELEFTISIDLQLLNRFRRHTKQKFGLSMNEVVEIVGNPVKTASEWTHDLLEHERRLSKSSLTYYFAEEPNINLGWGGGLLTKTVDLLLPEHLRAELLRVFKRRRPYHPAPSSRRLTKDRRPLGWAKIEEVRG
jgi:CRISPR-associated protein Csm5